MFLMSSADFKHRGISQEEFPRVFDFILGPGVLQKKSPKSPKSAKLFSLR